MARATRAPTANEGEGEPCPHHGAGDYCTECPGARFVDGFGFPHPSEARGRRPLRRCRSCTRFVGRDQFVHDIPRAIFACRRCARLAFEALGVRAIDRELDRLIAHAVAIDRAKSARTIATKVARRPPTRPRR